MINYEFSTEYDSIRKFFLNFSDIYDRKHPNLYPHIYFDALHVVVQKLIQINDEKNNKEVDRYISEIVVAYSTFSEAATRVNNARGVGLSVLRMWDVYEKLKKSGLDNQAQNVIGYLISAGMAAAAHQRSFEGDNILSKPIHEWVIDKLLISGEYINDQVWSIYTSRVLDFSDNHDEVWGFLTNLGKRLGTNFGYNFDPYTGERYSDDDPRRK